MECDNVAPFNNETMIETKDITKMVAHIVRRDKGIPDTNIMHPMREWVVGLAVVFLLVAGGVVFNIIMYQSYSEALSAPVTVTETVVPYKAAVVAQAITHYQTERTRYKSLLGTVSALPQSAVTSTEEREIPSDMPVMSTTTATTTAIKATVPEATSSTDMVPRPAR